MLRSIALVAALAAATAFASQERIAVLGDAAGAKQLKDSLCISEDCVDAHAEKISAVVHAREAKGKLEVSVKSPEGSVRFTKSVALAEDGSVGSMDLMSLSAAVVHAIEYPADAKAEHEKAEKAEKKLASAKKAKSNKRLASRKMGKGAARG